jgi:hypothetical protein
MSIDGTISKAEFKARNDKMNAEFEACASRLKEYRSMQERNANNQNELAGMKKRLEALFLDRASFQADSSNALLDRIIVHKLGHKRHVRLEIILNFGRTYAAEIERRKIISLHEIGISQAQVSRLEKSALKHMRKYV